MSITEKKESHSTPLVLDNVPQHPPHLDDPHLNVNGAYLALNTFPLIQTMDWGAVAL